MARYNPRRFSDPDWLRSIEPARLIAFLQPWAGYLAGRGYALPKKPGRDLDCAGLSSVLMAADTTTPSAMIDALHFVRETSTPEDCPASAPLRQNGEVEERRISGSS